MLSSKSKTPQSFTIYARFKLKNHSLLEDFTRRSHHPKTHTNPLSTCYGTKPIPMSSSNVLEKRSHHIHQSPGRSNGSKRRLMTSRTRPRRTKSLTSPWSHHAGILNITKRMEWCREQYKDTNRTHIRLTRQRCQRSIAVCPLFP